MSVGIVKFVFANTSFVFDIFIDNRSFKNITSVLINWSFNNK